MRPAAVLFALALAAQIASPAIAQPREAAPPESAASEPAGDTLAPVALVIPAAPPRVSEIIVPPPAEEGWTVGQIAVGAGVLVGSFLVGTAAAGGLSGGFLAAGAATLFYVAMP